MRLLKKASGWIVRSKDTGAGGGASKNLKGGFGWRTSRTSYKLLAVPSLPEPLVVPPVPEELGAAW